MRYRLPSILVAACAALAAAPASAQDSDAQLWTTTTISAPASENLSVSAHFVARLSDNEGGIYQLQAGIDASLDLGDGVNVGAGYSYVPSYEDGELSTREHRVRQEVSLPLAKVAGGQIAARLRLEQRWRSDGDDIKLRLRPRITWTRPIGPDGLAVRLAHESFYNLNDTDWGEESRYDRMRNQVSLRRDLGGGLRSEVGYLNQYIFQGARPDEIDHALTLALSFEL